MIRVLLSILIICALSLTTGAYPPAPRIFTIPDDAEAQWTWNNGPGNALTIVHDGRSTITITLVRDGLPKGKVIVRLDAAWDEPAGRPPPGWVITQTYGVPRLSSITQIP